MPNRQRYELAPITLLKVILEFAIILVCVWFFTRHLQNFSPDMRVHGNEFSYLVSSGTISHVVFEKTGAIPLWNPFIGPGEPLFENPFSFILNPLMTWPILWWGPFVGATVSILVHILLFAFGGWTLARVLRMGTAGRLLLALLLAGSGSLVAALGDGFYQMGLSQTYVPWIIAGVIGTLYLRGRWAIGVLAVATTLMVFAGTFWYVLPTAFAAGLLILCALFYWDTTVRQVKVDTRQIRRVAIAAAFMIGLAAIRLIPQFVNASYVDHPLEMLNNAYPLSAVLMTYFQRLATIPDWNGPLQIQRYHFILPIAFAVGLVVVRVLTGLVRWFVLRRRVPIKPGIWRILVPAFICIAFFTVWAQEGVPIMRALYESIGFLREWRYVGRMGAVASFWIAVVAALWLDDIGQILVENSGQPAAAEPSEARPATAIASSESGSGIQLKRLIPRLGYFLVIAAGLVVAFDVMGNLSRVALELDKNPDAPNLVFLREQHPTDFLPVLTQGFFNYFQFYDVLARPSFGNPDYKPQGRPATLGTDALLKPVPPTYAIGIEQPFVSYLQNNGYLNVPDAPPLFNQDDLWQNPSVPGYAFTATLDRLNSDQQKTKPLAASDVLPVTDYFHDIDSIKLTPRSYPRDSVLVVAETSYPGWTATINGTPVIVESIANRIGVKLPNDASEADVVFSYRPTLLFNSAIISLVAFILFMLWTLRIDQRIPQRYYAEVGQKLGLRGGKTQERLLIIGRSVGKTLTRTDLFEPVREGQSVPDSPNSANGVEVSVDESATDADPVTEPLVEGSAPTAPDADGDAPADPAPPQT